MRIYVARHGQTEWNRQNRICGITDIDLTDLGRAQARQLAEVVAEHPIDRIICSTMRRAVQTAQAVAERIHAPLQQDVRLFEQNYGVFEGMPRDTQAFLDNKRQFATRYPQGESQLQAAHRVYGFLDEIRRKYPDENVLLVCHGGVCRIIRTYFMDMTTDEFVGYSPSNCQLEIYEAEGLEA